MGAAAYWHESNAARRLKHCVAALVVAFASIVTTAGSARANGALPGSFGILLPAVRQHDVVLATNFGMIISEDDGATWQWTCEQVETNFGYLYAVGPAPNDRYYGLSPEQGLAYSDDGSCSWHRSAGALADKIASDFFVDPTDAARVVAVAAGLDEEGGVTPQAVYESLDAGTTFNPTPLYTAPPEAVVVGLEIARSNPNIVYIAMYTTPGRHPKLLRSEDRGRTWAERDIEAAVGPNDSRILTVDRDDPEPAVPAGHLGRRREGGGDARRRGDVLDAADGAGGSAERVRPDAQRHGAGGGAGDAGQRRHERARVSVDG